jgi:hypothetical protein
VLVLVVAKSAQMLRGGAAAYALPPGLTHATGAAARAALGGGADGVDASGFPVWRPTAAQSPGQWVAVGEGWAVDPVHGGTLHGLPKPIFLFADSLPAPPQLFVTVRPALGRARGLSPPRGINLCGDFLRARRLLDAPVWVVQVGSGATVDLAALGAAFDRGGGGGGGGWVSAATQAGLIYTEATPEHLEQKVPPRIGWIDANIFCGHTPALGIALSVSDSVGTVHRDCSLSTRLQKRA